MKSDIQLAQEALVLPIVEIAKRAGIDPEILELYGRNKAKIDPNLITINRNGKLILVTAITPTPLGEGKSTTTIGLVDSIARILPKDKSVIGALREPSLGPVFGIKGGACGGGLAQVNPMADINLHFTGDLHAITSANNLISACIDNHIYHGNELGLDPNRILWQRCLDLNDRALRDVTVAISKNNPGRTDHFNITVASEIMAIFCLATSMADLETRIGRLVIGYNVNDELVTVSDLGISGSITLLLKDAFKPNLVQTLENNPILIHGGPFANIAHGCNSIRATSLGLRLADYVVTEAGFGADLGAEKFLDIKCRVGGLTPSAVVVVATIRALKYHGPVEGSTDYDLTIGIKNLARHIKTIKQYGLPYVVALNHFESDSREDIDFIINWAKENNHPLAFSDVFLKGSLGGEDLARLVLKTCDEKSEFKYIYDLNDTLKNKINLIAQKVYGASEVIFKEKAKNQLLKYEKAGFGKSFICMAKTPLSLTDDPKKVSYYENFPITIKEVRLSAGAEFIVCLAGDVMTMPGLPKEPLAKKIYVDADGIIHNLS